MSETPEPIDELQRTIGYQFKDLALLEKALTHASLSGEGLWSYERLEFLGDAVAGMIVAERLFADPERLSEGEMTAIKSDVVCSRSMAKAGRRLGLSDCVRVDRGLASKEVYPESVIADAYEALVAAVFLDGGVEEAKRFVLESLGDELLEAEERKHPPNFKSILQEIVQAQGSPPPTYHTLGRVGPDHEAQFEAAVRVRDVEQGRGWGATKKEAEQRAAEDAVENHHPDWRRHHEGKAK